MANQDSPLRPPPSPRPELTLCPTDEDPHPRPLPPSSLSHRPASHLHDKQSLAYALRTGLAGGLAGCAAKTVVAPLDRIKILFQTASPSFSKYQAHPFGFLPAVADVYRTSGVYGLFRGHSATLLRIFPYAAIKFLAYEQIRAVLIRDPKHETAWRRLASGSAAGVTSVLLTYPLEVVRVRMAFETRGGNVGGIGEKTGLRAICAKIYGEGQARAAAATGTGSMTATSATAAAAIPKAGGLANFYRGFAPTLLGMLPYAGTSFLTHDTIGDLLRDPRVSAYTTQAGTQHQASPSQPPRPVLKNWAELLSGATAGLLSQTASYPLEVIRRRMQVGGAVGDGHKMRIAETAGLIYRERGFRGYFAGLGVGYVKVVPMVAVSFWVYERGKLVLGI